MASPIIQVENLGKRYTLHHQRRRSAYRRLSEELLSALASPFRRAREGSPADAAREDFWALQGVSFGVHQGEVVGIIGRNGAGKSTLLKILSRITEPTSGRVILRGRVASLLEVGTGFHSELTGRENIFLNGTILGMTRAEIKRKFDEIVDFSGVEKFLDTPIKHYSSGMTVRLAFSVAAHLEPEILIIDEVLAVGDAEFQKRCLGKMNEVARGGRTVLFVSHNMAAVESLCVGAILLESGKIVDAGITADVIRHYHHTIVAGAAPTCQLLAHPGRESTASHLMRRVTLRNSQGQVTAAFPMGDSLSVEVEFDAPQPFSPVLGIVVKTDLGASVFGVDNRIIDGFCFDDQVTSGTITCRVDDLPLAPGAYSLDLYLGNRHQSLDRVRDALLFEVLAGDAFGSGKLPTSQCGPICWPATWDLNIASRAAEEAIVD